MSNTILSVSRFVLPVMLGVGKILTKSSLSTSAISSLSGFTNEIFAPSIALKNDTVLITPSVPVMIST
ncbi:hypothetical protein EB796_019077 [Bugula neritina]|uniref:Uncharacterized protein n=1 Tax=Bugula neritina TaxID=10212 RepID=A0A7J7J8Q0_BUGNE|nr:hypothetical protein EB796_019077 [Bugula neritina]